jgi:hypothetical protein
MCKENAIEHKAIALGTFLEIERAFDIASFDTIRLAAVRHGIKLAICRCICSMLDSWKIITTLSGET